MCGNYALNSHHGLNSQLSQVKCCSTLRIRNVIQQPVLQLFVCVCVFLYLNWLRHLIKSTNKKQEGLIGFGTHRAFDALSEYYIKKGTKRSIDDRIVRLIIGKYNKYPIFKFVFFAVFNKHQHTKHLLSQSLSLARTSWKF